MIFAPDIVFYPYAGYISNNFQQSKAKSSAFVGRNTGRLLVVLYKNGY